MMFTFLVAAVLTLGLGLATPNTWPYAHDPMAVDSFDELTNPTDGGIYTIGPNGVDIPVKVDASEDIVEGIYVQIWKSGNKLAETDLGLIPDMVVEDTIHLDANTEPGLYDIAVNGDYTDTITLIKENDPNNGAIPEFPSIAIPMIATIGLAAAYNRRKD